MARNGSRAKQITRHASRITLFLARANFLRPRPARQTDAGYAAVCAAAFGLLAAPKIFAFRLSPAASVREDSVLPPHRDFLRGHFFCPAKRRGGRLNRQSFIALPPRKRAGRRRQLPPETMLARRPLRDLPGAG